jgi:hypothetical protein
MLRSSGDSPDVLPGTYTLGTIPVASANYHKIAWVTDRPGGPGFMMSDGSAWVIPNKRIESYSGTTNGSGDFTVVYSPAFSSAPNVQPVTYPPADGITRVRVTSADASGFTVRTERNASVTILSIDVLSIGVSGVSGVPVRVLVTES